ncbi:ParB N-terminal domain-containing protein [Kitasatospora sp. NPDC088548]|uniref:ParB N-terminal domain-containing protein n=1 Tax=Kitasatospora sp. NPDC088548 TaxID=3364075 RepID=UPI00380745C2
MTATEQPGFDSLLAETTAAEITAAARVLFQRLQELSEDDRMDVINDLRAELHQYSPMKDQPVDLVLWVRSEQVEGNDYNPNHVAPQQLDLLRHSITTDGYTQPIVTAPEQPREDGSPLREVVDGFHRHLVGKTDPGIREAVRGRLPVTTIRLRRKGRTARQAATLRHNNARGVDTIEGLSDMVLELSRSGKGYDWFKKELGLEPDAVLKYVQQTGLAEQFTDRDYSQAWEANATPWEPADENP